MLWDNKHQYFFSWVPEYKNTWHLVAQRLANFGSHAKSGPHLFL